MRGKFEACENELLAVFNYLIMRSGRVSWPRGKRRCYLIRPVL